MLAIMATPFKLQYLIIVGICLHSRFLYGSLYELPSNGVKIITYGEPCLPPRYLPVKIEEPVIQECESALPKDVYQPLKLNYRTVSTQPPIPYQPRKYPIRIQIPQVPQPIEIIKLDPYRGKVFRYNIQTPPYSPSIPISTRYNFKLRMPPPPPPPITSTPTSVELLTDLTSRIDRILIPTCAVSSTNRLTKHDITSC